MFDRVLPWIETGSTAVGTVLLYSTSRRRQAEGGRDLAHVRGWHVAFSLSTLLAG